MRKLYLLLFALLLIPMGVQAAPAPAIKVQSDEIIYNFPEALTFQAAFQSDAEITSVTLEYGVEELTCGTVVALVEPQFSPGTRVSVDWTWEMRQSGSLPPGAKLWWRWVLEDASGAKVTTETKTAIWLDSQHNWQTISGDGINLHWYKGSRDFAEALHQSGVDALQRMASEAGLQASGEIDIYIYGTFDELRDAVLYEPGWTGGQAFPANNIVIMGVPTDSLEWGKGTVAHELTHILIGNLTFSCLGDVPTWLNEGLAMYGEGGLDAYAQSDFDAAVRSNTIFGLRALGGGFSEESERANLSYSQSYSVINFMIQTYGQEKMTTLLLRLRDGKTIDAALQEIYGFNTDGLEDAWRTSIGAPARAAEAMPTPTMQPTIVPTYVPVAGIPIAATEAATPLPPPIAPEQAPAYEASPAPGDELDPTVLMLLIGGALGCMCLSALLVGAVIFFVVKSQKRSDS